MIDFEVGCYSPSSEVSFPLLGLTYETATREYKEWHKHTNPHIATLVSLRGPDEELVEGKSFSVYLGFDGDTLLDLVLRPNFGSMHDLAWEEISSEKLVDQTAELARVVTLLLGASAKPKRGSCRIWSLIWGEIEVWGESRSFSYGVRLTPRPTLR